MSLQMYVCSLFGFFFFSSKRRHTRWRISDWSSDVCSSDLEGADRRMGLVALELAERIQVGILVVEADDKADGNRIVLQMVHKRPAIGSGIQRPAGGMHDEPLLVFRGVDLPDQIGRASCRERVVQYVSISVGAVSLKK